MTDELERIHSEFEDFDLSVWEKLEAGGSYESAPPELNVATVLPMLRSSVASTHDREWVVGFNTDLDFSVETVDEYARWCGRLGDPVAKELDRRRGAMGWNGVVEVLKNPIREAEAIDPVLNGLEEFHKSKLASLKEVSKLAQTKFPSTYVEAIEIRKEAANLDPLDEGLRKAARELSPEITSILRQTGCM